MKNDTRHQRIPARFGRQTRFKLTPTPGPVASHYAQTRLEQLKSRLLDKALTDAANPQLCRQLRLAANEAAAVAWTTPFPALLLPVLLQEKIDEVHQYARHQEEVQLASQALAEASG